MGAVEIDQANGLIEGGDRVARLDFRGRCELEIEHHAIELALRALETCDLRGRAEARWQAGCAPPDEGTQDLTMGGVGGADPHKGAECFAHQRHHRRPFPTRNCRQGGEDGLVLGHALAAFGPGKLIGHVRKVESTYMQSLSLQLHFASTQGFLLRDRAKGQAADIDIPSIRHRKTPGQPWINFRSLTLFRPLLP